MEMIPIDMREKVFVCMTRSPHVKEGKRTVNDRKKGGLIDCDIEARREDEGLLLLMS